MLNFSITNYVKTSVLQKKVSNFWLIFFFFFFFLTVETVFKLFPELTNYNSVTISLAPDDGRGVRVEIMDVH